MRKKINFNLPDEIVKALYRDDLRLVKNWLESESIESKDKDERTLIFYAVLSGNKDAVTLLLKNNSQVNLKDKLGWTPLHYAAQNYLVEITQLLIQGGAEIDAKDDYGNIPLWRAVFASQGKGEIIKLLLSNGADPNKVNNTDVSPLVLAKTIANYDIIQFFE